jgi:hypothetical protein
MTRRPIIQFALMLVALIFSAAEAQCAAPVPLTFYVQFVRGTDKDAAPAPNAQLIGAKLRARLDGVFKWKNYWEIKRETVNLKTSQTTRKRMSAQQEVEIALLSPLEMTVSIYSNGKLTRKRKQPIDTAFYIAGGDRDNTQSWFIVVRRDNPAAPEVGGAAVTATP